METRLIAIVISLHPSIVGTLNYVTGAVTIHEARPVPRLRFLDLTKSTQLTTNEAECAEQRVMRAHPRTCLVVIVAWLFTNIPKLQLASTLCLVSS